MGFCKVSRRIGTLGLCRTATTGRPGERMKEITNQELFYTKNSEWAYEREWRVVDSTFSADGDPVDISQDCWPFVFRADAVKQVIVGHRGSILFPEMYDVLRLPQYAHVSLCLAIPDQKRLHLNFTELPRGGWGAAAPPQNLED